MPSDALSVAVTTGLGVSVLAGILSGICYILTHGLPSTRTRKPITPWHCNVCGGQFRSIQGILEVEKVVTCAKCKEKVCRVRCSKRDPLRGWICQICQQPETWFKGLLKSIYLNKDCDNKRMDPVTIDELDEDLNELRKKEREQVRDFIEKMLEAMLGGNLDDVSVSRIYNDKKYLPITGQSPCSAHAYLKQLIQRFSGEASELPSLKTRESHPAQPEETLSNRTYEDLLSTAIINKVVQTTQNEARSSATSSRASASSKKAGNKEYFFGEETLESKWKNNTIPDDASSVSSLDEWVRSDSSISSSKYVDRVSLTIKQHIEEGSSSDEETEDNISHVQENSLLHPTEDSWHENWYFQKRRLLESSSPVPVPMLVPNPITDAKVLIGDKEAEELSDIDSDYGDPEVVPNIKNILVNSKKIIGGKNPIHAIDESFDSFHSVDDKPKSDEMKSHPVINEYTVNTNDVKNNDGEILEINELHNEPLSLISVESNTEQDTEYTEQYASLPRTFLKNSDLVSRTAQINPKGAGRMLECGFDANDEDDEISKLQDESSDSDIEKKKVFKGSYSEREKEKWKHSSVEIPDNPYSSENLERRLSSRSSDGSTGSMFGRDYYIKNAAKSAGARSGSKLFTEAEVTEDSYTLNGNIENVDETTLVTAIPAVVETEESNGFESINDSPSATPLRYNHDISSDSDLSIERVYNLQSGKVFEKKGNIQQEISTQESHSPEGLKYVPKEFDEDVTILQTDENHNNATIANNKIAFMRSLTQTSEQDILLNDCADVREIIIPKEDIKETIDEHIVPYEVNKFDIPLEMSKVEKNNNNTKSNVLNTLPDLKTDIFMVDSMYETDNISKPIDTVILTEPKFFGDIKQMVDNKINTSDYSEEEILSDNREFSLEYSTDINEDDMSRTESSLETDPEIIDLKEKRLVKDLLGKFSTSYPNISNVAVKKIEEPLPPKTTLQEIGVSKSEEVIHSALLEESSLEQIPSVKNLKQLFDKEGNHGHIKKDPKQIYSLTARSLPRDVRQKLKSDDESSLQNEELIMDKSTVEEEPVELLPLDITKNRIAFYEDLGNKKKQV